MPNPPHLRSRIGEAFNTFYFYFHGGSQGSVFPVFNDSTTGIKKQKTIRERAGEKCPECEAKILTASVITEIRVRVSTMT